MPMHVWKRMTVGFAIAVILALALTTVHGVLTYWQAYDPETGPAAAALSVRVGAYPPWLAVTLIAVMLAAVWWAKSGRALTVTALVVASLSLLVLIGFGAFRVAALAARVSPLSGVTEVVLLVATMILPVVSIVVLVRLLAAPQPAAERAALPAAEAEPVGSAPVWKPDQAAGAHWQTAGAAASGAAAQNWGRPGEKGGWTGSASTAPALPAAPAGNSGGAADEAGLSTPGTPQQPVHQPRPPERFGPQALAQQYESPKPGPTRDGGPASTPEGRREPPRWTPLDRPSGQGPS